MEIVDPVKDASLVPLIGDWLRTKGKAEDIADVWDIGVNMTLRISDLLSLKFSDVMEHGRIKDHLVITESKTSGKRRIHIGQKTAAKILERRAKYPNDVYLFQGHSNRARGACKPLTSRSVGRKLQEVGEVFGIRLGTHSMRKTRGYQMHVQRIPMGTIAKALGHKSTASTMHYIGVVQEDLDELSVEFEL